MYMIAVRSTLLAAGLALSMSCWGQGAPAGAPAGTTAQCKDKSYSSSPTKRGACSGHGGVAQWYGSSAEQKGQAATAPAPSAAPAPTQAPPASKSAGTKAPPAVAAPGGGPGQVWVNTDSNVYHCPGDRYYGTTKKGEYMTEAAAKAAGARPSRGKACS